VLPGVREALERLRGAGLRLVVVTNQPDVARGTQRREAIDHMHARLAAELLIDEFRVCDHDDGDGCGCRKPKPGLLLDAAREAGLSLAGSSWSATVARRRSRPRADARPSSSIGATMSRPEFPDAVVRTLPEAADWILSHSRERTSGETCRATVGEDLCRRRGSGRHAGTVLQAAHPGVHHEPTLMRKAGVTDYRGFAREVLAAILDRPISFEVFPTSSARWSGRHRKSRAGATTST
jgi:D-glycero-D-manno-heptose 1,7-bisphosphate phosphatase